MSSKLAAIKRRIDIRSFKRAAKAVTRLAPIEGRSQSDFTLVSMLCERDIYQYLLAVYSFCDFLVPKRIVVIDDGSLSMASRRLLQNKLSGCDILEGESFLAPGLPTYSSWQRIQAIASLVEGSYVVQMDSDLFFQENIEEVSRAVSEGRPFMLGTDEGEDVISAAAAQVMARQFYGEGERHIQCLCEINLDAFPDFSDMKYVRACAGFSGFPRGSFIRQNLVDISEAFTRSLGDQWPVWGSEQVTSNVLLSNMDNVEVLPLAYYDSVERYRRTLKMVHFIGNARYQGGIYTEAARRYIRCKAAAG